MDGFDYRQGELYVGSFAVKDIEKQFGTPVYLYSAQGIQDNFARLKKAFGKRSHHIHYAIKANPNLGILAYLNKLGAGFDVVSGGELTRVLKAGGKAENIVFSGVGKSKSELELALNSNISAINIESAAELERLQSCAAAMNKIASVSIRVNPDVDAGTHEYISTGLKENKFGVDTDIAIKLYQRIQSLPNVEPVGIAYHIGSQITSLQPLVHATEKVLNLVDRLAQSGITIRHLDMGGGLGVRYQHENPPSFEDYVSSLVTTVDKHHKHLRLSIEPGRSIVANAGLLITKVEYLKTNNDKHFAIVDAAMNDLIRPSLYQAWMNITEVSRNPAQPQSIYDVVGPICESTDFLGKNRKLAIAQDDLLAVQSAGAYCMSMSSNYNSRPRPAEILVDNDTVYLIRERETYVDLFDKEIVPDFSDL